jgi:hypothetical protein
MDPSGPIDAMLAAYRAAQGEAHALIEELTQYLARHQACATPAAISWGDVADITYLIGQLDAVLSNMR